MWCARYRAAIAVPRTSVRALLAAAVACCLAAGSPAPAAAAAPSDPPRVLVVGDSLAVGTEPFLGGLLGGAEVAWDARSGRTTPQGLTALRTALKTVAPQVVVISLGTNDGSDPRRFAERLTRVLGTIPPAACIVWPALFRPPRKGPYLALNRVLRARAQRDPRLSVLGWDRVVTEGKVALPDGLHPDAAGYEYRSRMIAGAVRRGCAPAIPS